MKQTRRSIDGGPRHHWGLGALMLSGLMTAATPGLAADPGLESASVLDSSAASWAPEAQRFIGPAQPPALGLAPLSKGGNGGPKKQGKRRRASSTRTARSRTMW